MNIKQIKQLIEVLEQSDLDELEVEQKDFSVRLVKHRQRGRIVQAEQTQTLAPAPLKEKSSGQEDQEMSGHAILSPMVGTFYGAPAPGRSPFVKVGDMVKEGDTLCIVEAMKTMNQIKSDRSGRVKKLPVENGMPVEYHQVLCILE